jgi:nucleoside-diphosphate-sugar epimerase
MTVALTGGTGFLGSAVALELLAARADDLAFLVRPTPPVDIQMKAIESLRRAAICFGRPELLEELEGRVRAVPADLSVYGWEAGVSIAPTEVWHFGASLAHRISAHTDPYSTNLNATAGVLKLAERVGAQVFHCSTAYVAGRRSSSWPAVMEAPHDGGQCFRNDYERSKFIAERLVLERSSGLVLRPCIVVGHSGRGAVLGSSASGIYPVIRWLARNASRQRRAQLVLGVDEDANLSLLPIELMAKLMVKVAHGQTSSRIFHLCNSSALSTRFALSTVCKVLGLHPPRFVDSQDPSLRIATTSGLRLAAYLGFHEQYLNIVSAFDVSNTERVCGPGSCRFEIDHEVLSRLVGGYLAVSKAG